LQSPKKNSPGVACAKRGIIHCGLLTVIQNSPKEFGALFFIWLTSTDAGCHLSFTLNYC
jgi:hypothetical protein